MDLCTWKMEFSWGLRTGYLTPRTWNMLRIHLLSHSFLPSVHSLIHSLDTSSVRKLLCAATGCWEYRWEQNKNLVPSHLQLHNPLAQPGFKPVIHPDCAQCRKGWDKSAVARPGLDIRRCETDFEDLRMRRIMSWEDRGMRTERGHVLQMEQGMCWKAEDRNELKAGQRVVVSLGTNGRHQGWRHCDVHSWLLCTLLGAQHNTGAQQIYSELTKAKSSPRDF